MNRLFCSIIIALFCSVSLQAQTSPDAAELTKLLNDFLWGAAKNDMEMHERFWADDLIYTGSSGRRVGKADIIKDVSAAPTLKNEERTTYSAEDVRIQQYGDTAIVAFRLVAKVERGNKVDVSRYLNSGTFLKRKGKWQVVNWQATRLPRSEADDTTGIVGAEAAFHEAMLKADIDNLERLLDEKFLWTQDSGVKITRAQLIDYVRTGRLRYSSLETSKVRIDQHYDTAIATGVTVRTLSAGPNIPGGGESVPFTAHYTLTFANKGGVWKAVALHTSR